MTDINIRAGADIYEMIRDDGLSFDHVSKVVGPAVGPRWLLACGFDLALIKARVLGRQNPVTLAGSSAGALRFAAWIQPEPEKAYDRLIDSYISMNFTREDTPSSILEKITMVIDSYVENDALPFIIASKKYRMAITTARARHLASSENKIFQASALFAAGILNFISPSWLSLFFEPIVFYSGYMPPAFCRTNDYSGVSIPLNEANFKRALLASSAVPLAVSGVKNIYGAPTGTYRDGGLVDYHGNHNHVNDGIGVAILLHHQERLIPTWLDRYLKKRTLPEAWTRNLLVISPGNEFIEKLPGGRIPDRGDFKLFVDNPAERMKQWRKVVAASSILGEWFLECVESGKIRSVVRKL
ncbi:MAG: hypothetical protein PHU03_00140 [Syntrophales bacterium]|nr:hypothetical protein [Syntrophales bacterium]